MEKWVGKRPTMVQKTLGMKYDRLLQQLQNTSINPTEKVLKVIEAECDKKSGRELDGVLLLTSDSLIFVSKSENFSFKYSQISDLVVKTDGKDKDEWNLTLKIGRSKRTFDDIKKNDDSQEFIEILEQKIVNHTQDILTTATHDFDYFLHAERLQELRSHGVKITSFLMKRDDMGFSKNGERLLREKHENAQLIIEGSFQEKQKKGNFIVVDKIVFLYEYDNKDRKAKLIISWPFTFFANAVVDHFAIKTEVNWKEGKLVLNSSGKEFARLLNDDGIELSIKKRKWHQKILGFRSGKWWKRTIALLVYLFSFLIVLSLVFGEEPAEPVSNEPTSKQVDSTEKINADEEKRKQEEETKLAEEKRKQEEEAKLAEEKRKQEEEAKLAEEKRKQEEEAKLAEEKRKQEEEARLAEENRKQEETEAARQAEEKRKQEEAAKAAAEEKQQTNVYYKNCDAARAAGAAPVHKGEPGYGKHLDRDGDGVGCDRS